MDIGKVFYVTKEKLAEIKKEHKSLVAFERLKTVGQEAPRVLESEDMSSEFVAYQEDMESLRLKIEELSHVLENHQIIKSPAKEKQMFVDLGAKVQVDIGGKHDEFMIVGTLEANPDHNKISNESPVGKALLGHKVGDVITISAPTKKSYKIKEIRYEIS